MYHFSFDSDQCPVCKTTVKFRSAATNVQVCSVCNSVFERNEVRGLTRTLGLRVMKTITRGIIQPGTKGVYNKMAFEVIGGIDCEMSGYYLYRWTILFTNGNVCILTEVEGFYAILETPKNQVPGNIQVATSLHVGTQSTKLAGDTPSYAVDKATCIKIAITGELALVNPAEQFSLVELCDTANNRYEIIEYGRNSREVRTLQYVALDDLNLQHTINAQATPVQPSCRNCGVKITIRWPHYHRHCICTSCNGWNELEEDSTSQLRLCNRKFTAFTPAIPIGSKGSIKGIDYEVTGAMKKNESGSIDTNWTEYTLFNPATGYAWLSEYNGHWTYLKEVKIGEPWPEYKDEITRDNEPFVKFNEYGFRIISAAGEFNQPLSTDHNVSKEYISPPEMYAAEKHGGESITWFKGEYISGATLFEGLNLDLRSLPQRVGIGPLEPMKGAVNMQLLWRMTVVAILVFLILQVLLSVKSENQVLFENSYIIPDSTNTFNVATPSFQLKHRSSNVSFILDAPVSNSWLEADITMVNDRTGQEYNFQEGVEYYSGYAEGEHWSEGATASDEMLSSIPAGNYHLNILASTGGSVNVKTFSVRLTNDIPMWRNLLVILGILLLYPAVMWWRTNSFEKRRWNNGPVNNE